jgi:hypothetical protein
MARKEVVTQAGIEKINKWKDLLSVWNTNHIFEFSVSLLHIGLKLIPGHLWSLENQLEKAMFYLDVARWEKTSDSEGHQQLGRKAYELLVHNVLPELAEMASERWKYGCPDPKKEAEAWLEIIRFFASRRLLRVKDEPYRSDAKRFVWRLHSSLGYSLDYYRFPSEVCRTLKENEESIAKAMVNVGAFWYIIDRRVSEAIPALKEEIAQWCWGYNPGEEKMLSRFPQGRKSWMDDLDLNSEAFQIAMIYANDEARALMELTVRLKPYPF